MSCCVLEGVLRESLDSSAEELPAEVPHSSSSCVLVLLAEIL